MVKVRIIGGEIVELDPSEGDWKTIVASRTGRSLNGSAMPFADETVKTLSGDPIPFSAITGVIADLDLD